MRGTSRWQHEVVEADSREASVAEGDLPVHESRRQIDNIGMLQEWYSNDQNVFYILFPLSLPLVDNCQGWTVNLGATWVQNLIGSW